MQLFERLWVYKNSQEAKDIQAGYQAAIDGLIDHANNSEAQCFVFTATWSLERWEEYLGLPIDRTLPDEIRRERIIAKLRGSGVSTVALIESVAESYYNGDCAITEQFADYTFTVTFLSTRGEPPGLAQLKQAIEEIKPAHLGVIYVFLYTTHEELRAYTHAQLSAYTNEGLRQVPQGGG